jgi:hypothetical protein
MNGRPLVAGIHRDELAIAVEVVLLSVVCPALLQGFGLGQGAMLKRPNANISTRTETFGGACWVRWLQTGHHIVGGRIPREHRISLSIASRRSRRAISSYHVISGLHSRRSASIISENHVRLASPAGIDPAP